MVKPTDEEKEKKDLQESGQHILVSVCVAVQTASFYL